VEQPDLAPLTLRPSPLLPGHLRDGESVPADCGSDVSQRLAIPSLQRNVCLTEASAKVIVVHARDARRGDINLVRFSAAIWHGFLSLFPDRSVQSAAIAHGLSDLLIRGCFPAYSSQPEADRL
jgi:hypothetical protein